MKTRVIKNMLTSGNKDWYNAAPELAKEVLKLRDLLNRYHHAAVCDISSWGPVIAEVNEEVCNYLDLTW